MSNFVEKLISVAEQNEATKGLISKDKAEKLCELSSHMLEVNEHLNLTAIKDEDGVIRQFRILNKLYLGIAPILEKDYQHCVGGN